MLSFEDEDAPPDRPDPPDNDPSQEHLEDSHNEGSAVDFVSHERINDGSEAGPDDVQDQEDYAPGRGDGVQVSDKRGKHLFQFPVYIIIVRAFKLSFSTSFHIRLLNI